MTIGLGQWSPFPGLSALQSLFLVLLQTPPIPGTEEAIGPNRCPHQEPVIPALTPCRGHSGIQNSLPKLPQSMWTWASSLGPFSQKQPNPMLYVLMSRNGQGKAVCRSCGLLQAGYPHKCEPSWCWKWREGRLPPCIFLPQVHKYQPRTATEDYTGLQH